MVKEDSIGRYQHQDGKDDGISIAVELMKDDKNFNQIFSWNLFKIQCKMKHPYFCSLIFLNTDILV